MLLSDFAALQAHWSTILAVVGCLLTLISSLITAATPYPRVETVLHRIMGILSFVQHFDVGGLSIPGMPLRKPAAPPVSVATGGALKALLLVGLALTVSSCAGLGAAIESDLVNCGESGIQSAITPANLTSAANALMGPTSDVEPMLTSLGESLGIQAGSDAVFCMVGQVVTQLESGSAVAAGDGHLNVRDVAYLEALGDHNWVIPVLASSSPDKVTLAIIRGEQIVHGWSFKSGRLRHRRTR